MSLIGRCKFGYFELILERETLMNDIFIEVIKMRVNEKNR